MTENEHKPRDDEEELDEFEVVELESEDGELDEFVIIDRFELEGGMFAVMASLEEVEAAEDMTEAEFEDAFGEEGLVFLMREEAETFIELTEEENKKVKETMDRRIAENTSPESVED